MANNSSDSVQKQVKRLFNLGTVGSLSDAQLLDWFVSERDESREAAFEELMIRHGSMVFRVCRCVLQDTHDAEDAFQAVFLVLAHRARTIRRRDYVASWLFGVAHRVASRTRRRAARLRALDEQMALRTCEGYLPAEECHDWAVLHEEIDRLPERLRAPLVLCYLEGLTYEAAAHQLGLSDGMLRGRLSRSRERLRTRLLRRGLTVPAGLLAAGAAGQAQAAIPLNLIQGTTRIALGFMAGNTAAVLARGVLNSMLMNQLKVVAVILVLGIGSSYWAWRAIGAASDDKVQAKSRQVAGKTAAPAPLAAPKSQAKATTVTHRFTGAVKVEGTGEPVAGAKLEIASGDIARPNIRVVETGIDGRFATDLRPGNVRVWLSDPPTGYMVSNPREFLDGLVVGSAEPAMHREYHVRKGIVWNFWFTRGVDQEPVPGFVGTSSGPELFQAQADVRGQAHLTLPTESRKVALSVSESSPFSFSAELFTGFLLMNLEWETDFRPDELAEILRMEGNERRFRLIDADAKSATLQAPDSITPVIENGKLVIRVALPHRDSKDFAALTGQVLDDQRRPIAGAHVALVGLRRLLSDEPRQQATTDAQGRYRLRDIPRRKIDGKPIELRIAVTKEGYAGLESPLLSLGESDPARPQVIDPIQLERGVALSGIVVDQRGKPAAGVWVRSTQFMVRDGFWGTLQSTETDEQGHFRFRDLLRGLTELHVFSGKITQGLSYFADGSSEEVRLKLLEPPRGLNPNRPDQPASPPTPVATGQPAPEWQVGPWSDGRDRKLADQRGKVVVLFFWGISRGESVSALSALGKLATTFQNRGVEFLAIHNAAEDEEYAQKQAMKVLAFKGAPLVLSIDQTRNLMQDRGTTAYQYGIRGQPVLIVIDRAGKIAFRSDSAFGDRNFTATFRKMVQNPREMTEQKANELIERTVAQEIERVLKQKD